MFVKKFNFLSDLHDKLSNLEETLKSKTLGNLNAFHPIPQSFTSAESNEEIQYALRAKIRNYFTNFP